MSEPSWAALRREVYTRAKGICEYCQTAEANTGQIMEIEHIVPNGGDGLDNLCLACGNCNRSKASATFALDPLTSESVPLFNPRTQVWVEHFQWSANKTFVEGISPIGRATVGRLRMNNTRVVLARARWRIAGFHPPNV